MRCIFFINFGRLVASHKFKTECYQHFIQFQSFSHFSSHFVIYTFWWRSKKPSHLTLANISTNKSVSQDLVPIYIYIYIYKVRPWSSHGCPCDVVINNKLSRCEFGLQSRYFIHFWTNPLEEGMNAIIPPALDRFVIKWPTKVYMSLNKETKLTRR